MFYLVKLKVKFPVAYRSEYYKIDINQVYINPNTNFSRFKSEILPIIMKKFAPNLAVNTHSPHYEDQ